VKLLRHVDDLPRELRGGAVTIGNFDGVHLGHACIVARVIEKAQELGGPALVFTFEPHPVRLLRPAEAPPPLTWLDRKAQLLADLGVDAVIAYPTDERLLSLSAQEFFDEIIREKLDGRAMVEGPNFYFGRGRAGTIDVLKQLTSAAGISLDDSFRVVGTRGVGSLQLVPAALSFWRDDGYVVPDVSYDPRVRNSARGALRDELSYLCDCVAEDRAPELNTGVDGQRALRVAQALIESAATGVDVEIQTWD